MWYVNGVITFLINITNDIITAITKSSNFQVSVFYKMVKSEQVQNKNLFVK